MGNCLKEIQKLLVLMLGVVLIKNYTGVITILSQ